LDAHIDNSCIIGLQVDTKQQLTDYVSNAFAGNVKFALSTLSPRFPVTNRSQQPRTMQVRQQSGPPPAQPCRQYRAWQDGLTHPHRDGGEPQDCRRGSRTSARGRSSRRRDDRIAIARCRSK